MCIAILMTLGATIANKWSWFWEIPSAKWCKHVQRIYLLERTHSSLILDTWKNWCFKTTKKEHWTFWKGILHVSRALSYIVAVTWFLEEHIMFYRILAIYLKNIDIFTGPVQGILRWCIGYCIFCIEFCIFKNVAANWKTHYIWYKNIAWLKGYYTILKKNTFFEKECCIL